MDLKQLRTFVHVAELGSLSKAADRLHIAQPALSRQIRLLEAELRVALFSRHGRGMVLTAAGARLLTRATGILTELEAARADVTAETGAVKGRVVLGTPPTVGDTLSAHLAQRYLAAHPDVSIRIVSAFSGYLLDWLQRGEIDLAVMYEPERRNNLKIEPLLTESLYAIAGPGNGLSRGAKRVLTDVLKRRLVMPGPQHGLRKLVEREAQKADRSLDIVVEADSLQTMKDLVERNMGWTILPYAAVHREVAEGRLMAARIIKPDLVRTLVIAESIDSKTSRATRLFRDALIHEVRSLVEDGIWSGTVLAS